MFGLTVRDHMMIAHSFNGEIFGPAQKVHGATYVVDVTFERHQLDKDDLVVDIGLASELLKSILSEFNMQNLDELPERQLQARLEGRILEVKSVDKFPQMTDYVVPRGVRIAAPESWNWSSPSSDHLMKPSAPERHSTRYVWKSLQCVAPSAVLARPRCMRETARGARLAALAGWARAYGMDSLCWVGSICPNGDLPSRPIGR